MILVSKGAGMDYSCVLAEIAKEYGGVIETRIASERGISKATLSNLCKNNMLIRIARGQYTLPDELEDELLAISMRSGNIIFSHETALYLHDISDRTPFVHAITAPSDCIPSPLIKSACKVYYIKSELFSIGKTTLQTYAGNYVPGYDLERTICDIVRSRSRIGTETFTTALKLYSSRKDKDLNKLSAYADLFHVQNILRPYLEMML